MDQFIRDYENEIINTNEITDIAEFNNIFNITNSERSFSIYHNNIRSIQKNFQQFEVYISQFNNFFSCIILTETWNITDKNLYSIDGYEIIHNNNRLNQNDGILVYIKRELTYDSKFIKIGLINAIDLDISFDNCKIKILAIYRPPSTCVYDFINNLSDILQNYNYNLIDYTFILGDINIDISSSNADCTEEYLNLLAEKGFVSIINKNTRVTNLSSTCIDHIFVKNKPDLTVDIIPAIIKTNITDHYTTVVQIINEKINLNHTQNTKQTFKKVNEKKLLDLVKNECWEDIYNCNDPEKATRLFYTTYESLVQQSTSVIQYKSVKKKKPWISKGLVTSIKERDKLFQDHIKHPLDENRKQIYINYRNKLNALIKKTKNKYFKTMIEKNKNCSKNLWNAVKQFTNNYKNNDKKITKIVTDNGNEITDPKQIANTYNTFFSQIGEKLASKIQQGPMLNNNENRREGLSTSMFLEFTDSTEIKNTVLEFQDNKAPGPDGITNELLKLTIDHIAAPLCFIINKCIECGKVPTHFKKAIVKPLFKEGDKHNISNYRPISLISSVAKIFEKIIKKRLNSYLEKNKIISDLQFGFRKNISTQDAIAKLTSLVYNAVDDRKACLGVFVDLAKAFDTVSHRLLLDKLEHIGIRGNVLNLFKSYLEERKQVVEINQVRSHEETVSYGVPQGTVIGPVLFTIYLNQLLTLNSTGTIISYADDTVILYSGSTWADVRAKAEKDLKNIMDWFNANLLTVNVTKTKVIPFTSFEKYLPDYTNVPVGTQSISIALSTKYLGIYIDSFLRWDVHIKNVVNKLRGIIPKMYQLRQILPLNKLKILYYGLVESIIQYGIIGWGGLKKTYLQPLEKLQKRILKVMYNKSLRYPSEQLYRELNLLDIRQIFSKITLIYLFNNSQYVTVVSHLYNTRANEAAHLFLPRAQKTIGQRCFTYTGPRLYNVLPDFCKHLNVKHLYKKHVKNWIASCDRNIFHNIIDPL